MTAKELLQYQIDDAAYQLEQVFDGVQESLDFKLTETAMTPREIAIHLGDCYSAVPKLSKGESYNWGSYVPSTTEWPALWNEVKDLRAQAVAAAFAQENWETHTNGYIVAHDYYHVGQMARTRLARDSEWDAYSIYKS